MGRVREKRQDETVSQMSEALLFTTMCFIGLPVQLHIKDGSVFSGIFHTASFNKGYGVVLKNAKMVKKGTQNANIGNGDLIDTLVVRAGDLVQVLAKDVVLPADFLSSDGTSYDRGADVVLNQKRHVGIGRPQEEDQYRHASELIMKLIEADHSAKTLNGRDTKILELEENQATSRTNESVAPNGTSNAQVTTQLYNKEPTPTKSAPLEVSTADKIDLGSNARSSMPIHTVVAPQNAVSNRMVKESKLNPDAKIFSPSLSNSRSSSTPSPPIPSVSHVPNNFPAVQVAGPQSEVGIRPAVPRLSWPVKVVPYVTSAPAMADNGFQHGQTVAGHVATRAQPVRHQVYQPLQALPPYLHANHQNGMFGRPGQVVYMHPVTHPPASLSQAQHPLFTTHPVHVTKHEGALAGQTLQASMNPPMISHGPQPYMIPSHHFQLSQPLFSSMRPVPVLGPNVPYSAKFT